MKPRTRDQQIRHLRGTLAGLSARLAREMRLASKLQAELHSTATELARERARHRVTAQKSAPSLPLEEARRLLRHTAEETPETLFLTPAEAAQLRRIITAYEAYCAEFRAKLVQA